MPRFAIPSKEHVFNYGCSSIRIKPPRVLGWLKQSRVKVSGQYVLLWWLQMVRYYNHIRYCLFSTTVFTMLYTTSELQLHAVGHPITAFSHPYCLNEAMHKFSAPAKNWTHDGTRVGIRTAKSTRLSWAGNSVWIDSRKLSLSGTCEKCAYINERENQLEKGIDRINSIISLCIE